MSPACLPLRLVIGGAVLFGGAAGAGAPLMAQTQANAQAGAVPVVSQPVVQNVPGGEGMKLNDALNRLAKDPRDVAALLDAGKASLDLGDVDAAIGFFQRASTLSPGNPRAKAGLAGAYVLKRDPFTAIPLFNEAELAGPIDPARLADRGLAYDLVGDGQTAQRYYRESLVAAPNDETLRRLALSQAISGDRRGMEATLSPLLQKQDKAAWRTRSFALAILGYGEEAEAIARQSLPADRATAMSAYLRYMPRLTPSQQAGAGNLGHFPRAAEVGVDDPRVVQFARVRPRPALAAAAPAPVNPSSAKGKGKTKGGASDRPAAPQPKPPSQVAATPVAPPEPKVGKEVNGEPVQVAVATELPPQPKPQSQPQPQPQSGQVMAQAQPVKAQSVQTQPGFASLEPASTNPVPGFDLKQVTPAPPAPVAPVQAAATSSSPVQSEAKQPSLEEVFADFVPTSTAAEPTAGAVDVRKLPAPPLPKTLAAKEPVAKDAKGKTTKDAAKDAKLADCAEPPAKGKAGTKGKATAKSGTKAGSATSAQCKDGKPVKAPTHPSRIWVQVATGKNKKALAFDWGKFAEADPVVFKGRKGFTSAWGQTNRLLTGPFESEAAANAYIAKLKKAGVTGAFLWTSPAGQVVDALP